MPDHGIDLKRDRTHAYTLIHPEVQTHTFPRPLESTTAKLILLRLYMASPRCPNALCCGGELHFPGFCPSLVLQGENLLSLPLRNFEHLMSFG